MVLLICIRSHCEKTLMGLNEVIFNDINNGVYKAGFATS